MLKMALLDCAINEKCCRVEGGRGICPVFSSPPRGIWRAQESPPSHLELHKVPAQFLVIILPPISCMLAGVRLAVIDSDLHRGVETILNFATVCNMVKTILGGVNTCKYEVERGLFNYSPDRISPIKPSLYGVYMSYFLLYPGREFLCWFAINVTVLEQNTDSEKSIDKTQVSNIQVIAHDWYESSSSL